MPDNKLRAQIAANSRWAAVEDRTAATAPARAAFEARFRNENERRVFFLRLALKSAQARRARKATTP